MRRKIAAVIISLATVTVLLSGCKTGNVATGHNTSKPGNTVESVLEEQIAKAEAGKDENSKNTSSEETISETKEEKDGSETGSETVETEAGNEENSEPVSYYAPKSPSDDPWEMPSEVLSTTEGLDIDLTILSSNMIYTQVYNMMITPEDYIGKNIKMSGFYTSAVDNENGKIYHACIIPDATACCTTGIEFVLAGDYKYPDDYPEEGGKVAVEGVFDTYEEDGYTYCTLREAKFD